MLTPTDPTIDLFGYKLDFCHEASIVSAGLALLQIIEFIIFYLYRNEDGVKSRRPVFTYFFCIISTIYFIFIIPSICSDYTINMHFLPFIGWYLLRCCCIFVWFWTLICKFWFLYFDYNYVILLRLQAMHNNTHETNGDALIQQMENKWNNKHNNTLNTDNGDRPISNHSNHSNQLNQRIASKSIFSGTTTTTINSKWFEKHKKDFGNPKKASFYIGIYFLLCFLVLLFLCIIEQLFDDPEINIFNKYTQNQSFFTNLQLTEIGFIAMCYVPFITAIIFTFRIWAISESWKIRQEIITIFIVTAVLFIIDTALTGCIFINESTRITLKLMIEGIILFWTTIISTIMVVHFIRKQNMKQRRRRKMSLIKHKARTSSAELIREIAQNNILPIDNGSKGMGGDDGEIPLGYILSNQLGYSSFLQHCVEEINVENLLFLAHVCYFKKRFLDRIKDRQLLQNAKIKSKKNIHYDEENNDNDNDMIELQSITTDTTIISKGTGHVNGGSIATIRTDVAVYDDNGNDKELDEFINASIDWSPSNCLAILTFRMCHNFERDNNRLTLIDSYDGDIDQLSEHNQHREIPLYIMATNLYNTFIRENSKYEINLPAKIKTTLHFFFHQNFKDLDHSDIQYHEYRLFHIFDKSWGEIWHLLTLNSYRRFLMSDYYLSIKEQLELALIDEKPSLYRLIILDSNNDQHIATLIESHDPYKRKKIICSSPKYRNNNNNNIISKMSSNNNLISPDNASKIRLNSLNIEEMHELKPTSLINIGVDPLPIDEQVHHFGKTMTKVKKARV